MEGVTITYTQTEDIPFMEINRIILSINPYIKTFNEYKNYLYNLTNEESDKLYDYIDEQLGGRLDSFEFVDLIKDEDDIEYVVNSLKGWKNSLNEINSNAN